MSKGKLATWVNDNLVLLVCVPLIIGIHWGWSKLQDNPLLVDQSQRKEVPIIGAFKSIEKRILGTVSDVKPTESKSEEHEK